MKGFLLAYIQVALVVCNTWQIANGKIVGAVIVGFLISFVWTLNVKRVAFGCLKDRLVYSSGACLGTLSGLCATQLIYG